MDQVRLFALGGLDEDGKNMYVVEVGESIFVIEAGLKYPESTDQLGIERIIPDFKYLIENQHRIQAIFISHGHDDVMAALPNLLRHVKAPVYSTPLTAMLIEEMLKKEGLREIRVHRVKRNSSFKIAGIPIRTFGMTQSIADGFGLSIETPQGAIVYTSEYIVDYDIHNDAFSCDITALAEIGKRGVLALMTESVGADREGHSAPHHRITEFARTRHRHRQLQRHPGSAAILPWPAHPRRVQQRQTFRLLLDYVMIGDDHFHAQLLRQGQRGMRRHAVIHGQDQRIALFPGQLHGLRR